MYMHAYIHDTHTHTHTIHMYTQAALLCPHIYLASDEFLVESLARGDPELARSHLREILPVGQHEHRITAPTHVGTGAAREEREGGGKGGCAPWELAVTLTTLGSFPRAAQRFCPRYKLRSFPLPCRQHHGRSSNTASGRSGPSI